MESNAGKRGRPSAGQRLTWQLRCAFKQRRGQRGGDRAEGDDPAHTLAAQQVRVQLNQMSQTSGSNKAHILVAQRTSLETSPKAPSPPQVKVAEAPKAVEKPVSHPTVHEVPSSRSPPEVQVWPVEGT